MVDSVKEATRTMLHIGYMFALQLPAPVVSYMYALRTTKELAVCSSLDSY